jgi:hypothetical protein
VLVFKSQLRRAAHRLIESHSADSQLHNSVLIYAMRAIPQTPVSWMRPGVLRSSESVASLAIEVSQRIQQPAAFLPLRLRSIRTVCCGLARHRTAARRTRRASLRRNRTGWCGRSLGGCRGVRIACDVRRIGRRSRFVRARRRGLGRSRRSRRRRRRFRIRIGWRWWRRGGGTWSRCGRARRRRCGPWRSRRWSPRRRSGRR